MALNKKDEAERLRIQLEIQESLERQTKNLSSWRDAQKQLVKNAKLLKVLSADIAALEEESLNATRERKEEIKKEVAELKKQEAQLKSLNKELSSTKNLLKAAGNSAIQSFKGLLPSLSDIINKVLELDDITRSTAANLGMSGNAFQTMKMATEEARQSAIRWNQPLDYAVKAIASYNEESGRLVQLTTEQYDQIGKVALQTGMAAEEVATMAGQMEAFGLGAGQSVQMIADIQAMSEQMGVNAGKVIKKFQANLGMLNKLNFRGGTTALAKMSAFSEKFKLSMEAVAGVADKVFRPEGAIEASARLQTMGGAMAQLGDPFQLMYQARNAPEELAKSLTKAAKESATFNKETGEFEMSALELERLRESADALGMDYTELVKTAKQASKMEYMDKFLPSGMDKKDKDMILGMAQMTKDGPKVSFFDGGEQVFKKLSDLDDRDRKLLVKQAEDNEKRAEQAKSVAGQWQSIQNGLLLIGVELLQPLVNMLAGDGAMSGLLESVKEGIIDMVQGIRSFFYEGGWEKIKQRFIEYKDEIILGIKIGAGLFIAIWVASQFAAGAQFGLGFRSTRGPIGGGGGGGTNVGKSGKGLSGLGGGLKAFGQSVANPAMILAIAGALWIMADAIEKLAAIPWPQLILASTILAGLGVGLYFFMQMMGSLGSNPMSWLGVALILAVGAAFMMLGAAIYFISAGIAMVVDSFTNMFSIISMENIGAIMMLGPALMLASLGIMALAASILVMGLALANPFGLLGLFALATAAFSLKEAFSGVDAGGIVKAVDSVNSVNTENIEALKSLSMWLGMMGNSIKIEFGQIEVDGEIDLIGQNGAKANSDLLNDPIFMRELKGIIAEHTEMDKKGGR